MTLSLIQYYCYYCFSLTVFSALTNLRISVLPDFFYIGLLPGSDLCLPHPASYGELSFLILINANKLTVFH